MKNWATTTIIQYPDHGPTTSHTFEKNWLGKYTKFHFFNFSCFERPPEFRILHFCIKPSSNTCLLLKSIFMCRRHRKYLCFFSSSTPLHDNLHCFTHHRILTPNSCSLFWIPLSRSIIALCYKLSSSAIPVLLQEITCILWFLIWVSVLIMRPFFERFSTLSVAALPI